MARMKKTVEKQEFSWLNEIVKDDVKVSRIRYGHLGAKIFRLGKTDQTWSWLINSIDRSSPDVSLTVNLVKGWNVPTLKEAKEAIETIMKVLVKRENYKREN
ncbi:MAG: hypothetical protein ACTSW7_03725 [Candidatus Thorarchaeota archaeon]